MHARKTGALIRAAAAAGAVMAGATEAQLRGDRALRARARPRVPDRRRHPRRRRRVGRLGKTAGKDAAAGKPTYPALYGLEASRRHGGGLRRRARVARAGAAAASRGHLPAHRHLGRRRAPADERSDREDSRLDALLVARGLAASRERARALILAGQVRVDGARRRRRPARRSTPDADVTLIEPGSSLRRPRRRQARARARRVRHRRRPAGSPSTSARRRAASPTCCCAAARARVVALDVGHGQLDWQAAHRSARRRLERVNARTLTPEQLPEDARAFELATMDVSFISARQILPALVPLLAAGRRSRGPRQTAVRGGPRRSRQGRTGARSRRALARGRRSRRRGICARIEPRRDDRISHHGDRGQSRVPPPSPPWLTRSRSARRPGRQARTHRGVRRSGELASWLGASGITRGVRRGDGAARGGRRGRTGGAARGAARARATW